MKRSAIVALGFALLCLLPIIGVAMQPDEPSLNTHLSAGA